MAQVKPTIVPVNRRMSVPEQAASRLLALFAARRAAEEALSSYIAGLADGLGVSQEQIVGYDDEAHELVLSEADPALINRPED